MAQEPSTTTTTTTSTPGQDNNNEAHTKRFEAKAQHFLLTLFPCSLCAQYKGADRQRAAGGGGANSGNNKGRPNKPTIPAKFIATYKTFYTTISPAGESLGSAQVVVGSQLSVEGYGGGGQSNLLSCLPSLLQNILTFFASVLSWLLCLEASTIWAAAAEGQKQQVYPLYFPAKGCATFASGVPGTGTSTQVGGQFFCGVIKWYLKCSFKLLRIL